MNIAEVLVEQARARAAQPAIVDRDERVSFATLEQLTAEAAFTFARAGLRPGDRALVFCPMSVRLYVALIGLFRLGVAVVAADPSAGRSMLDRCCRRLQPRGFVGVPRAHLLRLVSSAVRAIPVVLTTGRGWPGVAGLRSPIGRRDAIEPCSDGDPALITFTSGSTGEPKAALRTHGFLLAQHRALADSLALRPGQVDLATLPVFVLANLASGVTSVIADADLRAPGAVDPVPLVRQIRSERPTRTVASPALLLRVANQARAIGVPFDSLEDVFTGGAPVFPRTLDRLQAMAPRAAVCAVYGSTEAEPIAHVTRDEVADADRAAMRAGAGLLGGIVVPSLDLRILPDRWGSPIGPYDAAAFDRIVLSGGQHGEIVVAGAHVLPGYLDGRGDEATKFRVGDRVWHRTGDAGYLDRANRLWLLGRCAGRVDDARGTLYPFAVECAAMALPWVARAALATRRGGRVLVVELDGHAPRDAVHTLTTELRWAALQDVLVVDRVPMDPRHNAKVDYPRLRALLRRMG
jgi:olefin beta-lactone synthetase